MAWPAVSGSPLLGRLRLASCPRHARHGGRLAMGCLKAGSDPFMGSVGRPFGGADVTPCAWALGLQPS